MKSLFALGFLLGVVPEIAISYIGMKLLNEGWIAFGIIWGGIQIIHLLRWCYISLASWILFYFGIKSKIADGIYQDLVQHKFPNPKDISHNLFFSQDYFNDVAADSELSVETRLVAKEIGTILDHFHRSGELQTGIQWDKSARVALKKYSDVHFPS